MPNSVALVAILLSLCLCGCSQSDHLEKQSPPYSQTMRWRFADPSDSTELAEKKKCISHIDQFWNNFKNHQNSFKNWQDYEAIVAWMQNNLPLVDNRLMWEAGPSTEGNTKTLSITADGNDQLRPMIETMIARAPKLSGWKFATYREPLADKAFFGIDTRIGHELAPFDVVAAKGEGNVVNLSFQSAAFKNDDADSDRQSFFILCEKVLGGENLEQWVGSIDTKRESPEKIKSRSLLQSRQKLKIEFSRVKHDIVSGLPDRPYFTAPAPENRVVGQWGEDGKEMPRRVTLQTWLPAFSQALSHDGFSSCRLSKCDEKFCYLQVHGVPKLLDVHKRAQVEDAFDQALRQGGVGCVVGAGAGLPDSIYIDFALADIDKAIPILRQVSTRLSLPLNACLRFYDAEWKNEWIGMYPHTDRPDMVKVW